MRLESLGEFNQMCNNYREFIDGLEKLSPLDTSVFNKLEKIDFISLYRFMINSAAITIAQSYDKIDVEDEEIYKKRFGKIQAVEKLAEENNLSYKDTIKQIRNCFCHGNYWIELDDSQIKRIEGTTLLTMPSSAYRIHLDNTIGREDEDAFFIIGDLSFEDVVDLEIAYSDCSRKDSKFKESWILSSDNSHGKIKNRSTLKDHINSLKRSKIKADPNGMSKEELAFQIAEKHNLDFTSVLYGIRDYKAEKFSIEDDKIPEKHKEFISNYINYLGFNVYDVLNRQNPLSINAKKFFDENVISATIDGIIPEGLLTGFFSLGIKPGKGSPISHKTNRDMSLQDMFSSCFQGPILYANMILEMCYYEFVYAKEVNSRDGVFDFRNLTNMYGFVPEIDDPIEPSVRHVNKRDAHLNRIKELNQEIVSKNKKISFIDERIAKVKNDEFNAKNFAKKEQLEQRLALAKELLKKEDEDFNSLTPDEIEYDDYTNFFRYIRNSIIHNNYRVDYNDALKSKKMEKIKFEFTDYRIEDTEKKNPQFRITLSAKQLLRLLKVLEENINTQVQEKGTYDKLSYQSTLSEMISNMDEYNTTTLPKIMKESVISSRVLGIERKNNEKDER